MKNIARIFKSLSDETRLRILQLLITNGELCICDLMESLGLPQSTVSRHVAYLKNTGWLDDRRGGVWMYYSIRKDVGKYHEKLVHLLKECGLDALAADDNRRFSSYRDIKNCL